MTARAPGGKAIFFVFITVLINMIGFGIIMPVMPRLIMDVTGQDLSHAAKWGGILSAVYAATQFFMSPVMGGLSDMFGRRPVILISLLAYSLDFFLMAIAPTIGFLLIARILAGAFAATFATANAFIADISPPEKRAANFGLIGAAFGLGFIIGPGLGGVLGDFFGPRAPFYAVTGLGLLNLVYGYFFLPETLAVENRRRFNWKRANALGNFLQFRQYPVLLPVAVTIFLYQLGHWALPSVWAYYTEERFGWSPADIGYSLMAVGLGAAIVQGGITRKVIPLIGESAAATLGLSIAAAFYVIYGLITQGWMVYAIIPIGSLAGLTLPALNGIMSRTLPANAQGELQGAISSLNGLSMIIGPFMMTQIFAAFTKPGEPFTLGGFTLLPHGAPFYFAGAPFVLGGCLAAAGLIPLMIAVNRIRRPTDEEAKAAEKEAAASDTPGV